MFTGQIRDLGDDRFYFFKSRYYDASIGKFHTADTVVPDPMNPQALNRYAYGLNNPLRFSDPSGHAWKDDFKNAHDGRDPSSQDWFDYQLSLMTGRNWSANDWTTTYAARVDLWLVSSKEPDAQEDIPSIFTTGIGIASAPSTAWAREKARKEAHNNRMRVHLQISNLDDSTWGPSLDDGGSGGGVTALQVRRALQDLYYVYVPGGARRDAFGAVISVSIQVGRWVAAGGINYAMKNVATDEFQYQGQTWHFDVDNDAGWNLRE